MTKAIHSIVTSQKSLLVKYAEVPGQEVPISAKLCPGQAILIIENLKSSVEILFLPAPQWDESKFIMYLLALLNTQMYKKFLTRKSASLKNTLLISMDLQN